MSDGTKEKISGKLKETEGKLTGDKLREGQGKAEQKIGDVKDKLDDLTNKDERDEARP